MSYPKRIEEIFQMIGEKYANCESSLRVYFDEQQENLVRVEAERDHMAADIQRFTQRMLIAQVQLAEAVEILRNLDQQWNAHDGEQQFGKLMQNVETLLGRYGQNQEVKQ